jgi:hypothetical protein
MQFLLSHAQYALDHGAHAIELDLHMRGGDVICNHDGPTPESPRLRDVMALLVQYLGQKATVHGDNRQFFLVLEPKDDDPAIYRQVFDILGEQMAHLSTAARPADKPRGITVVITGAHVGDMRAYFADRLSDLNRRCILEGHDYSREIGNLSDGKFPFQWTAIQHPGEYGRVNALHSGTDSRLKGRYNVRVWGEGASLGDALASGADSINCDHEQVVPFEALVRRQGAAGAHPSLAVRGRQALLAWRGASSNNLYIALGSATKDGLSFPRQLSLTAFLSEKPEAVAPAAAILPDGRLLVVYEDPTTHALHSVCGRFTSASRFLTFEGGVKPLEAAGEVLTGTDPDVSVAPDGAVTVVYGAMDGSGFRSLTSRVAPDGGIAGAARPVGVGMATE